MTLEFRAAGGRPPAQHEVLLVEPGGDAWYLTGLPWPAQPPFDEIGAYGAALGAAAAEGLARAAADAIGAPPYAPGPTDAGLELVRLDGREAHWSPERRSAQAERLVEAARAVIGAARARPWAVVQGTLTSAQAVRLVNRGPHALAVRGGELRSGWGRRTRAPSPLRLAEQPARPFALPDTLAPGVPVEAALAAPEPSEDEDFDTLYALVHLRWRPPVAAEGDWLDGWLVAGRDA